MWFGQMWPEFCLSVDTVVHSILSYATKYLALSEIIYADADTGV